MLFLHNVGATSERGITVFYLLKSMTLTGQDNTVAFFCGTQRVNAFPYPL